MLLCGLAAALQPKVCILGEAAEKENPCAACNCFGPCGPRGPTGDAGEVGPQGQRGIAGRPGTDGVGGQTYTDEVTFANLDDRMPYDDPNVQNQAITLPNTYLTSGAYQWISDTTVRILQPGTYQVFFHANPEYVNNIFLKRNGVTVDDAIFSLPTSILGSVNDMEIFGQVILNLAANDELELWVLFEGGFSNSRMNAAYKNSASMLLVQLTAPIPE